MGKHTPRGTLEFKNAKDSGDPEVKQVIDLFEKKLDEMKAAAESAIGKAEKGEELTNSVKEQVDETIIEFNEVKNVVEAIEQKLAEIAESAANGGQPEEAKSFGQQFVDMEDFEEKAAKFGSDRNAAMSLSVKAAIGSATSDTDGAAGDMVRPDRQPGIVGLPDRKMTIRDLIAPGRTDSNTIEYVKETGFNNNAAGVAEGALKPQSDIKFDLVTESVKVIAHTMKASRQIMDDASQLKSYIDYRLMYGLKFKEENQLLNGDGTGQNLNGIVPQATAYAANPNITVASAQIFDTMRLAILQAALAEYPANGMVLNPIDWARAELTKDAEGRYIVGNPQASATPTVWSLPVVATQAMAVDKFLTGGFNMAAQIFDRWNARIEVATQNEDDFVKNMVTILCEERLALAVTRPEAFIYGDFGFVA